MKTKTVPYVVYMLRCVDDTLYTGIARDLYARLAVHESGTGSKYVRARLPFKLVYTEEQPNRSAATKREVEIKRMTRKEKVRLIREKNCC